jgi:hypothetical protein
MDRDTRQHGGDRQGVDPRKVARTDARASSGSPRREIFGPPRLTRPEMGL